MGQSSGALRHRTTRTAPLAQKSNGKRGATTMEQAGDTPSSQQQWYMRPRQAAATAGVGVTTFWRLAQRPDFPRPIRLSARLTLFDAAALRRWFEEHRS